MSFYLSLYLLVFINLTSSAFAGICALDNVTSQIGSYDNDSDLALFFAITRGWALTDVCIMESGFDVGYRRLSRALKK